ncbi:unnamed protein product [Microthlaspi erraticum]|uniref:Uncharacterized protein n=1 Tax=Microthlaspi erraticum TaxID=1685480 RepID=A0A6D2JW85_9BRAS|nr:unnamed protein product [Microthlaspi erraticum]
MRSKFHAFMYPTFGFGHMIPYLHLANKLAEKDPLTLPHVDGLPAGAETTSDLPNTSGKVISYAMHLLRGQIEAKVRALKPDLILFDFVDWVPEMAKEFGVKSVSYQIVSAVFVAMALAPGAELGLHQPPGYPPRK